MDREQAVKSVREAYAKAMKVQGKLNAMITFIDPEEQLERLQDIPQTGRMWGLPVVLKDNVSTKGIRTTAASRMLENYVPVYDACIVEKMRREGAVFIGKSSMDELAMGGTNLSAFTGPVHNPYDLERISGGSSGGSAALVASGVVPLAIGSDTGDSVRKPASFCGVVGVKPTYGRISRYGIIPYASSLDHVGYFTRSVEDAAKCLEVLAGRDDRDMTSSFRDVPQYSRRISSDMRGKRIALLGNVCDFLQEPEWKDAFARIVAGLREKGAAVEKEYMDETLMKAILPAYFIISNCEASANHSNLDGIRFGLQEDGDSYEQIMTASRTHGFTELIRKRFVIGSYGLFKENQEDVLRQAQKARRLIVEDFHRILDRYDALIAPASLKGAPRMDESSDELSDAYLVAENYMAMMNFSGDPSMTVPAGYVDGMPVGLNVTSKAFDEVSMFSAALAVEEITGLKGAVKEVLE